MFCVCSFYESALPGVMSPPTAAQPHQFLTHVSTHNEHMPPKLWLMCGHSNLNTLARPLNLKALEPPYAHTAKQQTPYTQVHQLLGGGISEVAAHFKATQQQQEVVVFVDTAAALDVLTAIALCAVTRLIIPAEPDSFSTQVSCRSAAESLKCTDTWCTLATGCAAHVPPSYMTVDCAQVGPHVLNVHTMHSVYADEHQLNAACRLWVMCSAHCMASSLKAPFKFRRLHRLGALQLGPRGTPCPCLGFPAWCSTGVCAACCISQI